VRYRLAVCYATLTLQRIREIVGSGSDAELELARDQLYALADVAVCAFVEQHAREQSVGAGFARALRLLPGELAEDATERAAIIEFEAGRCRDEAERQALVALVSRHRNVSKDG